MSRILFAWELGANLGHLSRDAPVAEKLREAGHDVVFAVRDTGVAAEILGPLRFDYIQAPIINGRTRLAEPPANYAEVLEAEGWCNRAALRGHLHAWLSAISKGEFDVVIADHAPGALIAAHVAGCIRIALGNGFEIPPDIEPMPAIRSWQRYTDERLMASQRRVLADINAVVVELGGKEFLRLGQVFGDGPIFVTFGELDHYGQRSGACYVGSIHGLNRTEEASWPSGEGHRVLVYVRPQHQATAAVMTALAASPVCAVCVIPGAEAQFKAKYQSETISIIEHPVALEPLLEKADALIGYASIGTMTLALLKGTPLLMIPTTVEQYLVAKRAEEMGAGILIADIPDKNRIHSALASLLAETRFKDGARIFAERYTEITQKRAASDAAQHILCRLPRQRESSSAGSTNPERGRAENGETKSQNADPQISHWDLHARQWSFIGSPLRPCAEDVRLVTDACMVGNATPRILLLGVTPELANYSWPAGAQLTAVDLHPAMIRHCWAGNKATRSAVCADWLSPPFKDHQFDNVIGDGCLTLLSFPDQYRELSRAMYRVVAPNGVWVMRQFCRPRKAESMEVVQDDLWKGKIGNVHALKWRIAMAVHSDRCDSGVVLDDIWQAYRDVVPDPQVLEDRFGWDSRAIGTLDNYRGSLSRYTFPTAEEIALAMPEFTLEIIGHGSYELADRCPILSLSPIPRS